LADCPIFAPEVVNVKCLDVDVVDENLPLFGQVETLEEAEYSGLAAA